MSLQYLDESNAENESSKTLKTLAKASLQYLTTGRNVFDWP